MTARESADLDEGVDAAEAGVRPGAPPRTTVESDDGRTFVLRGAPADVQVGDLVEIRAQWGRLLGWVESRGRGSGGSTAAGALLSTSSTPGPTAFGRIPALVGPASSADASAVMSGADSRLRLGTLVRRPDVAVGLVAQRMNRHTFWCGQSGSGKTYALGVALERILAATRLPIVVLDPNSDFVSLGSPSPDASADEAREVAGRDVRVLRPDDSGSPLRVRFTDLSFRGKAALLRLDPVRDRAEYNTLVRAAEDFDGREASEVVPKLRMQGSPDAEALAQRIENLGIATWQTTWAQGAVAATDVIAERPAATVLDLGGYDRLEEQLVVALAVLEDLWHRRAERRPLLLVVDEAHNLCPPEPETALGREVRDRLVQIAAEGRKYGLWLVVSTQRPSKVHPGVVSQCDNLTLMRMNSRSDLAELAELFGYVPEAMLQRASRFVQGEALLAGGFVPLPAIVRVRRRATLQGGVDVPVPLAD
ncbi:ATP-binding protein [Terrabacter sp. NPDC080008]|uniref:ATP-binding protein n=1 Tax=Terrabacter sp. NPDC080008 TaxID=3155176 RepID=UPI00344E7100